MRPVQEGMISYMDLIDGRVDLYDIARLNEFLDVQLENERRMSAALDKNREKKQ